MIKSLRHYHFNIWRVFVLVLPIIFTMALVLRPTSSQKRMGQNEFRFEMKQANDQSIINIRINPLQSSSCLVYALLQSGEKMFLGTVSHSGEYTFNYPGNVVGVQIVDLIRQKEIHTHYFDHEN